VTTPGVGTKGAGTSTTYDVLGRPIQVTDGDSGTTTRSYNAFGDVVKEVDAMGTPTFYKRDALGRATSRLNALDGTNATTFVWDTAARGTTGALTIGKIATSTSFDGTRITNTYDAYGRPSETTWNAQGRDHKIKQLYDATTGKVSETDYPTTGTTGASQLKVAYGYDSAGQVSSVTRVGSSTPYWKSTLYWTDGQRSAETDGTGMLTTRGYDDNRRWPSSIKTANAAGTVTIQDMTYERDAAGNVTKRTDADPTVNTQERFDYDEVDQLKFWNFTWQPGSLGAISWSTDFATQGSGVIQQTKTGPSAQSIAYNYFGTAATALPHAGSKRDRRMHADRRLLYALVRRQGANDVHGDGSLTELHVVRPTEEHDRRLRDRPQRQLQIRRTEPPCL
jgi:YD repeat-containing protein